MSRRLIVRAEAEFDITEAAVWYESRELAPPVLPAWIENR